MAQAMHEKTTRAQLYDSLIARSSDPVFWVTFESDGTTDRVPIKADSAEDAITRFKELSGDAVPVGAERAD